jgi:hypothetical protein
MTFISTIVLPQSVIPPRDRNLHIYVYPLGLTFDFLCEGEIIVSIFFSI